MALVNHAKKEINAKIVFFGPEFAGKATNLHHVYGKLKESFRGSFKSMNLQNDRMIFFDFVPSGQGTLNGYNIRFHVYTLTGEVSRSSSWKMVLKGVDGLVFVADSVPARQAANEESFGLLKTCLDAFGKSIDEIPCLVQCNKRDIANAAEMAELERIFAPHRFTLVPAEARKGDGVLESIFTVARMILKNLKEGGLDLDRQTEQLNRMAQPPLPDPQVIPAVKEPEGAGAEATAPETNASLPGGEPVVEFAGEPEILRGGRLRLPLSIKYEGKEKKISLDISLLQDRD
jgi:signal recognition particle receptor subunit beta